jgi:hypothetical protein
MTPKVGSVVVYGQCCASACLYSSLGHCAVVIAVAGPSSFTVREMNFYGDGGGFDKYDDRVSSLEAVLGFIYPPAAPPPPPPPAAKTAGKVVSGAPVGALLFLGGAAGLVGWAYLRPRDFHRFEGKVRNVVLTAERDADGFIRHHS